MCPRHLLGMFNSLHALIKMASLQGLRVYGRHLKIGPDMSETTSNMSAHQYCSDMLENTVGCTYSDSYTIKKKVYVAGTHSQLVDNTV